MKKKILITGINSYVGNSFAESCKENFAIDKISVRDESWKDLDFSKYDSILHLAAIVHGSEKTDLARYRKINKDLTIALADKAKKAGVSQFIFMSTMAVYGLEGGVGIGVVINRKTKPNPKTMYAISKYEAELEIEKLQDEDFTVSIIRPPMIYGDGSKGNYPKLVKLAKYAFIFPDIKNKRSVLHIDKLSQELKTIVEKQQDGIFMPQDDEYFCTSQFIKSYRCDVLGKKTYLTKVFNPIVRIMAKKIGFVNKVFGNLVYEKEVK